MAELGSIRRMLANYGGEIQACAESLHHIEDQIDELQKKNMKLRAGLIQAIEMLERGEPGPRSHEGACGPEAGCDGICLECASWGARMRQLQKLATQE